MQPFPFVFAVEPTTRHVLNPHCAGVFLRLDFAVWPVDSGWYVVPSSPVAGVLTTLSSPRLRKAPDWELAMQHQPRPNHYEPCTIGQRGTGPQYRRCFVRPPAPLADILLTMSSMSGTPPLLLPSLQRRVALLKPRVVSGPSSWLSSLDSRHPKPPAARLRRDLTPSAMLSETSPCAFPLPCSPFSLANEPSVLMQLLLRRSTSP